MPRKPKHEDHVNHERWLVSYADFITLLFAFFVVMYAISSVNEGKYRVLSDSLISAFLNAPKSTTPIPTGADAPAPRPTSSHLIKNALPVKKGDSPQELKRKQQEVKMKSIAKDILEVLAPLVKDGQVSVTQSSRGVAVQINASVLFAPAQADLETGSIKALTAVARVLAPVENAIQVEGYTDNSPIKSIYPSNWELSSARSSSVVRLFIENGVAAERLVVMGYGENRPVDSNDTVDGRARNRRVTIMILSEAQEKITELPLGNPAVTAR